MLKHTVNHPQREGLYTMQAISLSRQLLVFWRVCIDTLMLKIPVALCSYIPENPSACQEIYLSKDVEMHEHHLHGHVIFIGDECFRS